MVPTPFVTTTIDPNGHIITSYSACVERAYFSSDRVQLLKYPDDFSVAELRGGTMHIALNYKTGINASFCPNGTSTVHRKILR